MEIYKLIGLMWAVAIVQWVIQLLSIWPTCVGSPVLLYICILYLYYIHMPQVLPGVISESRARGKPLEHLQVWPKISRMLSLFHLKWFGVSNLGHVVEACFPCGP